MKKSAVADVVGLVDEGSWLAWLTPLRNASKLPSGTGVKGDGLDALSVSF